MPLQSEDADRPRWTASNPWSPSTSHLPGAFPPSPNPGVKHTFEARSIDEAVKARKDEFVRKKTIKVKVGTWNTAAMPKCYKDLGAWFAEGIGVKGLTQDLSGLGMSTRADSDDDILDDSDVEGVEEQEARFRKKSTSLPRHDSPAVPSGEEIDLYVLGLQEVIDVSSVTEAMKPYTDPNPGKRWKRALKKHLPAGYKKVVEQQLIGLFLVVFASPNLVPEISSVDSTSVGTGLMGYLGNKGAVSARIVLGEATRLVFVNCHLAAGADAAALERRIWDTQQILSRTKFARVSEDFVGNASSAEFIGGEDFAFWFGDLNYRLDDIPGEDVRRLLLLHARNEYDVSNASKRKIDAELGYRTGTANDEQHDNHYESNELERAATHSGAAPDLDPEYDPASLRTTLKSLFAHDQLRAQQRAHKAFHEGWREGEINFLPTYKYDVGSVAMFDSGEKKRSPSWCDRILYRSRVDYEQYQRRAKLEAEARRKDEEMHKRGLDDAASQEDVLFDYDPTADGDEYDDAVEAHDNDDDVELMRTKSGFEDTVALEEYVSHQRVLSSDHKPLSAVFALTYDSVDPMLKARVHREVSKEFDRAENENRPAVTLVLDHHSSATAVTDKSTDAPELKLVDFGEVRYGVLYEHHLTIANTGQIEVLVAFITGPSGIDQTTQSKAIPSWLTVEVLQEADKAKTVPPDLGPTTTRYRLYPGDTTTIVLRLQITDGDMVRKLNDGELQLDDVLLLRIANGRDYFIPAKGRWLQTSFFRSIEELVRIPNGVRALTLHKDGIEAQQQPAPHKVAHSAPQELFMLTDKIAKLAERVIAEWNMVSHSDNKPWQANTVWPFVADTSLTDDELKAERIAEIHEALDTATPIEEHLNPCTRHDEQLSLLCEVLFKFLDSLIDGVVPLDIWQEIDAKIQRADRSKHKLTPEFWQDTVMQAISSRPIHSVSFTFVTFMLNRVISEVWADLSQQEQDLRSANRSRSSTSASAMSDVSLSSIKSSESSRTKRSFLPSLTRRTTNSSHSSTPIASSPSVTFPPFTKAQLIHDHAKIFAPILIRSEVNHKKSRGSKKEQLERKVRALEAFLGQLEEP